MIARMSAAAGATNQHSLRARHAVILLSRSPSFPQLTGAAAAASRPVGSGAAASAQLYARVLPLLRVAGAQLAAVPRGSSR